MNAEENMHDSLGDRMKFYEKQAIFFKFDSFNEYVVARLDGKAFHSLTKKFDKPFDEDFISIMKSVAKKIAQETNALCSYVQSDEISLIWHVNDERSQMFMDGKSQKLISILASMATAFFAEEKYLIEHKMPPNKLAFFDCRVFSLPNEEEAMNYFIWRQKDCIRNSVLSLGQAHFSHFDLNEKSIDDVREMLIDYRSINWYDCSSYIKYGTFYLKKIVQIPYSKEEIDRLPEKHEARKNPDLLIERIKYQEYSENISYGVTNILNPNEISA